MVEISSGPAVTRITLNRPPLNILNMAMMGDLNAALRAATDQPAIRAVVLAAKGKAFSAGVDIGEHTREKVAGMMDAFHRLCRTLAEIDVPTVAAVAGPALGGGCEVVALCDIVIAAESATFGQPEIKVGVYPPAAAAAFPLLFGKPGLAPLLLGDPLPAREAQVLGLVTLVVPDGALDKAVDEVSGKLAALSARVLRLTKRAALSGFRRQFFNALGRAERVYLEELMATADAQEGLEAFLARRSPAWSHR